MAEPAQIISIAVDRVLGSIRISLDAAATNSGPSKVPPDLLREAYFRFEDIRFRFRSRAARLEDGDLSPFVILQRDLREMLRDPRFLDITDNVPYRPTIPKRELEYIRFLHDALTRASLTVAEALFFLEQSLESLPFNFNEEPQSTSSSVAARKIK